MSTIDVEGPWQSLSTVALVCGLGLMLINLAFWAGRSGHDGTAATAVYWLGQLLIVTPVATRLLSRRQPRHAESLGLVALLVVVEYTVKFCFSPLMFTFPDELEHWRSTEDILQTGNLFTVNYSLPISPDYPGLENVTAAFSAITGLSVFASGMVIVGVAHLLFVALLYAFFHKLSNSARVAGIGCLVYAMSPHFAFFDSMFIYQVLALPFMALAMYAVLRLTRPRGSLEPRLRAGWWVVLILSVVTVTVTHHVTAYVLIALLALIAAVTAVRYWRLVQVPLLAFGLTVAATAGWVLLAAPTTLSYLAPNITDLAGHFVGDPNASLKASLPTGPLGDHVLVVVLVLALAVLLLYGAKQIWRTERTSIGPITLLLASMSYFPVLVMRLVSYNGAERAGRAFTFVFIPAGYVVAVGVVHLIRRPNRGGLRGRADGLIVVALAVVMFAGSIAGGWPPYWERLPGAYQVGGFERSVSPQGLAGANWALTALGSGNRFGVDISNAALLAAYGRQDTVRNASPLYYAKGIGPEERDYLVSESVRYLFVDRRLAQSLPVSGSYFPVDSQISKMTKPIPLKNLDKFDAMTGVDRPFDSGDIVVYDLKGLSVAK